MMKNLCQADILFRLGLKRDEEAKQVRLSRSSRIKLIFPSVYIITDEKQGICYSLQEIISIYNLTNLPCCILFIMKGIYRIDGSRSSLFDSYSPSMSQLTG